MSSQDINQCLCGGNAALGKINKRFFVYCVECKLQTEESKSIEIAANLWNRKNKKTGRITMSEFRREMDNFLKRYFKKIKTTEVEND